MIGKNFRGSLLNHDFTLGVFLIEPAVFVAESQICPPQVNIPSGMMLVVKRAKFDRSSKSSVYLISWV
jgi:hypothetical protein